jgi:DNA polymerase-4
MNDRQEQRTILHLDMDCFFAAVEEIDNPELKKHPVIVGGSPSGRGVVCTANYLARKYGVRSAMSSHKARQLCPQAKFIKPRIKRYREISQKIHQIFKIYSNSIEPLSLDEAFLDITHYAHVFSKPKEFGLSLKKSIQEQTKLIASIGIGPNKFLAKLASDWDKPNGLFEIHQKDAKEFLKNLPIQKLWGIGPASAKKLQAAGYYFIRDIQRSGLTQLQRVLGNQSDFYYNLANGIDYRPISTHRNRKSFGTEETFYEDIEDYYLLEKVLLKQADSLSKYLNQGQKKAHTIQIKVKFSDFQQITRSSTLSTATSSSKEIAERALSMLNLVVSENDRPIRLFGISATNLLDLNQPHQLTINLFPSLPIAPE